MEKANNLIPCILDPSIKPPTGFPKLRTDSKQAGSKAHLHRSAVPRAIPVTECDLNFFTCPKTKERKQLKGWETPPFKHNYSCHPLPAWKACQTSFTFHHSLLIFSCLASHSWRSSSRRRFSSSWNPGCGKEKGEAICGPPDVGEV